MSDAGRRTRTNATTTKGMMRRFVERPLGALGSNSSPVVNRATSVALDFTVGQVKNSLCTICLAAQTTGSVVKDLNRRETSETSAVGFELVCGITTPWPDQMAENWAPVKGLPRTVSPAGISVASFSYRTCSSGVTIWLE